MCLLAPAHPLPQSCLICISPEQALLPPTQFPLAAARLLPAAELTGRWLLLDLLLLYRTLGGERGRGPWASTCMA